MTNKWKFYKELICQLKEISPMGSSFKNIHNTYGYTIKIQYIL